MKNSDEPPSCLRPPIFFIGQNSRGNWVVQEKTGCRGGLFVDRTQALRYIRAENGNRPYAFVAITAVFELDMNQSSGATRHQQPSTELMPLRQREMAG
jgi:hypothetical protein